MTVSLKCKGCKSTLKVPEQLAGKKVKCPKCATVVVVPADEEFVAVEVKPDHRVKQAPPRKARPSRPDDDEDFEYAEVVEDDDDDRRGRSSGRYRGASDSERRSAGRYREEDEDDRRRRRRHPDEKEGEFKPCPRCGLNRARRVMWTAWGSFYGPSMFNHVRCPKCGTTYNGKTGGSNVLAAIVFVSVPLLGIGAIIGAILFMLIRRGHL